MAYPLDKIVEIEIADSFQPDYVAKGYFIDKNGTTISLEGLSSIAKVTCYFGTKFSLGFTTAHGTYSYMYNYFRGEEYESDEAALKAVTEHVHILRQEMSSQALAPCRLSAEDGRTAL